MIPDSPKIFWCFLCNGKVSRRYKTPSFTNSKSRGWNETRVSNRPAFVKVEYLSREFIGQSLRRWSFLFIEFNTLGTGSPFGTWYDDNYIKRNNSFWIQFSLYSTILIKYLQLAEFFRYIYNVNLDYEHKTKCPLISKTLV